MIHFKLLDWDSAFSRQILHGYFLMTRTMVYKLLHDLTTRSDPLIQFIVLVHPHYGHKKRKRLEAYRAEGREMQLISSDWVQLLYPARWAKAS